MIAFVEHSPSIDLHGRHFLATFTSGDEEIKLLLTLKAFYLLKHECAKADAERHLADMDAAAKVIPFPKKKQRAKR